MGSVAVPLFSLLQDSVDNEICNIKTGMLVKGEWSKKLYFVLKCKISPVFRAHVLPPSLSLPHATKLWCLFSPCRKQFLCAGGATLSKNRFEESILKMILFVFILDTHWIFVYFRGQKKSFIDHKITAISL